MAWFHSRPPWALSERDATDESTYWNRREILKALGYSGAGALLAGPLSACQTTPPTSNEPDTDSRGGQEKVAEISADASTDRAPDGEAPDNNSKESKPDTILDTDPWSNYPPNAQGKDLYPAPRNKKYKVPERGLTEQRQVHTFNNFYEFSVFKNYVWPLSSKLDTLDWTVEITGLVEKPLKLDVDALMRKVSLEERVYRFRCVEAWAMTVPWTGFPLSALLAMAKPLSKAKYLKIQSVMKPKNIMPGIAQQPEYTWPYTEALRLDEAMNELAFVVTGVFGRPLSRQMGAPIRIVLPWKYGFKGPKSVVRLELTERQPPTFWNSAVPAEYGFFSNVNPKRPHPRWSQATERLLTDGKKSQHHALQRLRRTGRRSLQRR